MGHWCGGVVVLLLVAAGGGGESAKWIILGDMFYFSEYIKVNNSVIT